MMNILLRIALGVVESFSFSKYSAPLHGDNREDMQSVGIRDMGQENPTQPPVARVGS